MAENNWTASAIIWRVVMAIIALWLVIWMLRVYVL